MPASSTKTAIAREIAPLMRLALPLVLAMIGQMAISTTDMLMLGRLGPEALASVALALSLYHPLMLLGIGIGFAVTPLATEALTAHRSRQVRRVARQGLWAAIPFTIAAAPAFWAGETLFLRIGQQPSLAAEAHSYLIGIFPGLIFVLGFNVLRSFLTAFEMTRAVLLITIAAIPLNALFNYALIFGAFGLPALGVLGAGLGSSLTSLVMGMALIFYSARVRRLRRYALYNRFWRPDWAIFRRIHRIGIPIGLFIVLETSLFAGSAQLMGLIGTLELAAHQIAIQLCSIFFMIPLGIGQAATARVGIGLGQAGIVRAAAAGWAGMALALAAMGITAMLFWFAPTPLIAPFLEPGPEAAKVTGFAVSFLAIAAAFQLVDGLQVTAAHALRGLQDTQVPMWCAAIGYWGIGMPAAIYFGLFTSLAGDGVWTGLALGLAVGATLLVWRFAWMTRSGQSAIAKRSTA